MEIKLGNWLESSQTNSNNFSILIVMNVFECAAWVHVLRNEGLPLMAATSMTAHGRLREGKHKNLGAFSVRAFYWFILFPFSLWGQGNRNKLTRHTTCLVSCFFCGGAYSNKTPIVSSFFVLHSPQTFVLHTPVTKRKTVNKFSCCIKNH